MKRTLVTIILVFSLVLNLAVAATLGWSWWKQRAFQASVTAAQEQLSPQDMRRIFRAWPGRGPGEMRDLRRQIREKRAEMLDLLARNPQDRETAEKRLKELMELRSRMERQAFEGVARVLADLPEDKRQAFVTLMKNRMGPGMGMGMGRGRMGHGHGRWRDRMGPPSPPADAGPPSPAPQ